MEEITKKFVKVSEGTYACTYKESINEGPVIMGLVHVEKKSLEHFFGEYPEVLELTFKKA